VSVIGDEQPAVRVTLATIYDKLLEVDKKVDPLPAIVLDHDARLREVEKQLAAVEATRSPRAPWATVISAAAAVVAVVVAGLVALFK